METGSAELIAQLRAICGREFVLTDSGELATYQSDGLLHYRQRPLVAVLPADAQFDLHLRRLGQPLPVSHPIELLGRSINAA